MSWHGDPSLGDGVEHLVGGQQRLAEIYDVPAEAIRALARLEVAVVLHDACLDEVGHEAADERRGSGLRHDEVLDPAHRAGDGAQMVHEPTRRERRLAHVEGLGGGIAVDRLQQRQHIQHRTTVGPDAATLDVEERVQQQARRRIEIDDLAVAVAILDQPAGVAEPVVGRYVGRAGGSALGGKGVHHRCAARPVNIFRNGWK